MLDFKKLSFTEKKLLMRFLWEFELEGEQRKSMWVMDEGRLETLMEALEGDLEIGENVLDDCWLIFEKYIPELTTAEGQNKLGIEARFKGFCESSGLYFAKSEEPAKVLSFRSKK